MKIWTLQKREPNFPNSCLVAVFALWSYENLKLFPENRIFWSQKTKKNNWYTDTHCVTLRGKPNLTNLKWKKIVFPVFWLAQRLASLFFFKVFLGSCPILNYKDTCVAPHTLFIASDFELKPLTSSIRRVYFDIFFLCRSFSSINSSSCALIFFVFI